MMTDELIRKLGLSQATPAYVLYAPDSYALAGMLEATNSERLALDAGWAQAFYREQAALKQDMAILASKLSSAGQLWICWPKKTSGVASDLTDDIVRQIGLSSGLVDVKVAAIDETWSGLKFVHRLSDRKS